MLIERRRKPKGIVPLPSMADIAFILLVFFILTSTIDIERNIPVALPEARATESGAKKYFHVWLDSVGDCYVRGERMDREALYRRQVPRGGQPGRAGDDRRTPLFHTAG